MGTRTSPGKKLRVATRHLPRLQTSLTQTPSSPLLPFVSVRVRPHSVASVTHTRISSMSLATTVEQVALTAAMEESTLDTTVDSCGVLCAEDDID
jgi:hypothetical protein